MKKISSLFLCVVLILAMSACSSNSEGFDKSGMLITHIDFEGKKVGMALGTVFEDLAVELGATPAHYSDLSAGVEDVRKKTIAGYMVDLSEAKVFVASPAGADFHVVEVPSDVFFAPIAALASLDQGDEIIGKYNDFLAEIKADGTLAQMQAYWIGDKTMPEISLTGENGTLKVVTTGLTLPFTYFGENGELKGYCVELAMRFAAREGMNIEWVTVGFDALIPTVVNHEADICIDMRTITEERQRLCMFSDPHYEDGAGIIVLK